MRRWKEKRDSRFSQRLPKMSSRYQAQIVTRWLHHPTGRVPRMIPVENTQMKTTQQYHEAGLVIKLLQKGPGGGIGLEKVDDELIDK